MVRGRALLKPPSLNPLSRESITRPMGTGVRAIDGLLTCGRGQRVGLFGGSGVGKSTLLGMMARGTEADVVVLALVGERGREVRSFIEHDLGPGGLDRPHPPEEAQRQLLPRRPRRSKGAPQAFQGGEGGGLIPSGCVVQPPRGYTTH